MKNDLVPDIKKQMGQYWLDTSNVEPEDKDQFLINLSFCRRIKSSKETKKILFRDIDEGWVSIGFKTVEEMVSYRDSLSELMGSAKIEPNVLNNFM